MYQTVQTLHSYWAYVVLTILAIATINALFKFFNKNEYYSRDLRISLFALIVSHIQLLLGLIVYFVSPFGLKNISNNGMSGLDANMRLLAVEHPFVGILAIVLITIGFSRHKKKITAKMKFKILSIFYTIALVLVLSRLPWSNWFNL